MCVRHNDTRRLIICSNELLKTNGSRDNVDKTNVSSHSETMYPECKLCISNAKQQ